MAGSDDVVREAMTPLEAVVDELERLRAVVAAQREALLAVRNWVRFGEGSESDAAEKLDAALALDAEGVSEPGVDEKREQAGTPASADTRSRTKLPGSLTSPVDHGIDACYDNGWEDAPAWKIICACGWEAWSGSSEELIRARHAQHVAALTSPVDTDASTAT